MHTTKQFVSRWLISLAIGLGSSLLITITVTVAAAAPAAAEDRADLALSAGTAFTYQGSLRQGSQPAEGFFDLSFALYDADHQGKSFGQIDLFDVPVRKGSFAVELDFLQPIHSGKPFWLETQVRVAGEGAYTRIGPRDLLLGKGGTTCAVDNDVLITGRLDVDPGTQPGLNVYCCNEADLDGGGQITLQSFLGALRIDNNEIQVTALGTPQMFQINPHGGNIGLGVSNPAAPVHVPPGPDVTASGGGALVVGYSTNIAIDSNEIQAHTAGAPGTLYLNNEGGIVRTGGDAVVGGSLGLGIELVEVTADDGLIDAHCPSGKRIISGGCAGGKIFVSGPLDSTTWRCVFDDSDFNEAVALCGRVTW